MKNSLEQAGMAAYLPGMQYMLERMQAFLDEFRAELITAQEDQAFSPNGKRRGRPPKDVSKFDSWANLSPAEHARRSEQISAKRKQYFKRKASGTAKTGANGQALLVNGWPADPQARKKEMARRMAKWGKNAKARQAVAAARNGKASAKTPLSPQAKGWANMTPEARAKRAAKARRSQKAAVAALKALAGTPRQNSGGKAYWSKLTSAERTAEMQRRNKVAQANKEARAQ